jgi:hypothetical protein
VTLDKVRAQKLTPSEFFLFQCDIPIPTLPVDIEHLKGLHCHVRISVIDTRLRYTYVFLAPTILRAHLYLLDRPQQDLSGFCGHHAPHTLFAPSQTEVSKSSSSWRSNVIHLCTFSKSYCFPGHWLGLIAASPDLLFCLLQ